MSCSLFSSKDHAAELVRKSAEQSNAWFGFMRQPVVVLCTCLKVDAPNFMIYCTMLPHPSEPALTMSCVPRSIYATTFRGTLQIGLANDDTRSTTTAPCPLLCAGPPCQCKSRGERIQARNKHGSNASVWESYLSMDLKIHEDVQGNVFVKASQSVFYLRFGARKTWAGGWTEEGENLHCATIFQPHIFETPCGSLHPCCTHVLLLQTWY